MPSADNHDDHERFTRLLLESEPVMLRSIVVLVPNRPMRGRSCRKRQSRCGGNLKPTIRNGVSQLGDGFCPIETRRFLARQQRRAQLTKEAMEVLEQEIEESPDSGLAVEQHLATCLSKLTDKQRRLIRGYYHEGRSSQWLSEQEGRSVEAVYKAIQRIRRDLQMCIERQLRKEVA